MEATIASVAQLRAQLVEQYGEDRVRCQEPLARYVNWRVGGPADLLFIARTREELVTGVQRARDRSLPVTVIGYGANVLVSDRGIRGLVIVNRAEDITVSGERITADSGTNLVTLARRACEEGLSGLEFLIGIPGTVGGAIVGNAGTRDEWIGDRVERIEILAPHGELQWLEQRELDFGYRRSRLQRTGEIILRAVLLGRKAPRGEIEKRMDQMLAARRNQPTGPSAGSVFKNPPGDFAGRLIEACGLKGYRIGGAKISEQHANFIINTGGATAGEIRALIEVARQEVVRKFGIRLEEEVRYLGEWD
ncbi:MAG TPA: UDP-N-acetylmuramate dehydrogenase [Blastocatellia bacterium]|nr:UDP-N-acetylmuramate dehydrogenase [Blastocatellia bacterium]